jgi:hypothetical protein
MIRAMKKFEEILYRLQISLEFLNCFVKAKGEYVKHLNFMALRSCFQCRIISYVQFLFHCLVLVVRGANRSNL